MKFLKLLILLVFSFTLSLPALAQEGRPDLVPFVAGMQTKQNELKSSFDQLKLRVDFMNPEDARRKHAQDLLSDANKKVGAFTALPADSNFVDTPGSALETSADWQKAEREAVSALSAVNQFMLSPARPANVPSGDLIQDFIPGLIRTLFRFTSLAILVGYVVAGVMYITAQGNEERTGSAKNILYYTTVGFVVIIMAFAVVKAITDIDFFGFI